MGALTVLQRPALHLVKWAWVGFDWLFPPDCGGCGTAGVRWCRSCQADTVKVGNNICFSCGKTMQSPGTCLDCQHEPPHFTQLRSWAEYAGAIRNAIHRLKYHGDISLAEIFAQCLASVYQEQGWQVDLFCPVPVSRSRLKERGYNQSALLAWPAALACGVGYNTKALTKYRETRTQVGLDRMARKDNVKYTYQAERKVVYGKSVLVIDDVITSGSTMDACAEALLLSGATQVYGLSLARSVHYDQ